MGQDPSGSGVSSRSSPDASVLSVLSMLMGVVSTLFQLQEFQLTSPFASLLKRPRQANVVSGQRVTSIGPLILDSRRKFRPGRFSECFIRFWTSLSGA